MAKQLLWSVRALEEYKKLLDYILQEWGETIRDRIASDFEKDFIRIQNHPEQFPVFHKRKKVRRCVASPQTSIYFAERVSHIEIYAVYDNRRNPRKLKL